MIPEIQLPQFFKEISEVDMTLKRMIKGYLPDVELLNPAFRRLLFPFAVCASDFFLTPEELIDVNMSLKEIEEGKIQKFSSSSDLIKWLEL